MAIKTGNLGTLQYEGKPSFKNRINIRLLNVLLDALNQ